MKSIPFSGLIPGLIWLLAWSAAFPQVPHEPAGLHLEFQADFAVEGHCFTESRFQRIQKNGATFPALPPGWQSLTCESPQLGRTEYRFYLPAGTTVDTLIKLASGTRTRGRVLGPDGKPVIGATVQSAGIPRTATNREGQFGLRLGGSGETSVLIHHDAYLDTVISVSPGDTSGLWNLRLRQGTHSLSAQLKNLPESGASQCRVLADPLQATLPPGLALQKTARPDPESGRFRISGIRKQRYRLQVQCPDRLTWSEELPADSALDFIELQSPVTIQGKTIDSVTNEAIDEFQVFQLSRDLPYPVGLQARLRAPLGKASSVHDQGRFEHILRKQGVNQLCVAAPGYRTRCREVHSSLDREETILYPMARGLELVVTIESADTPGTAEVKLYPRNSGGAFDRARLNGHRQARFAGLEPGSYSVIAMAEGHVPARQEVDLTRDTEMQMALLQGYSLTGIVYHENGDPMEDGWLLVAEPSPLSHAPSRIAAGRFNLTSLMASNVDIAVASIDYFPLFRLDGLATGNETKITLPGKRTWRIRPMSGSKPLEIPYDIDIRLPGADGREASSLGRYHRRQQTGIHEVAASQLVTYSVRIEAQGYPAARREVLIPEGSSAWEWDVDLSPLPGLEILLSGPGDGEVPKGLRARLMTPYDTLPPEEGDGRRFVWRHVPPGHHALLIESTEAIWHWGYMAVVSGSGKRTLKLSEPTQSDLALSGSLPDGEPYFSLSPREAPDLKLWRASPVSGRDSANAFLRLPALPRGSYLLCLENADYLCRTVRIEGGRIEGPEWKLSLETSTSRLQLQAPAHLPPEGYLWVLTRGRLWYPGKQDRNSFTRWLDLKGLPPDSHALWVRLAQEYPAAAHASLVALPAAASARMPVSLPGRGIFIRLSDAKKQPIAGAWVEAIALSPDSLPLRQQPRVGTFTDVHGEAELTGLPAGLMRIGMQHPVHHFAPQIRKLPDEDAVWELSLSARNGPEMLAKLSIGSLPWRGAGYELLDSTGLPVAMAPVAKSDPEGRIHMGSRHPGSYRLRVYPANGALMEKQIVISGSVSDAGALSGRPGGWLEVLSNRPLVGAFLTGPGGFHGEPSEAPLRWTGPEGERYSLLFSNLPEGRFLLHTQDGELGSVQVSAGEIATLSVKSR